MVARLISIPLIIWLAYNAYQVYGLYNEAYRIWLIPPGILLAVAWISHRELDEWILGKTEKDLDEESAQWLQKFSPLYQQLSGERKESIRKTIQQIISDTMFINMNDEKFPDDAGLAVALDQALLRTAVNKKLVDTYVLYSHPFLTPNISEKVHTCEYEPEDKVVILSAEQLLPGFLDPYSYLNISLYIQASALLGENRFRRSLQDDKIPSVDDLAGIIGQPPDMIAKWTGLDTVDDKALLIYAYFYFHEKLEEEHPEAYKMMHEIFGIHTVQ